MRCPYCQAGLAETQSQCSGCGLSLSAIDALLGAPPALRVGLSDGAGLLGRRDRRRVAREIREFPNTLPQTRLSVATFPRAPDQVPLGAYAFWLFNRSDIVRKLDKGGRNHDILIALDARTRNAAITIGYGLEPFVGKHHLQSVLASGHGHLVADLYGAALVTIIDKLRDTLKKISAGIPAAFALPVAPVAKSKTAAEAAMDY